MDRQDGSSGSRFSAYAEGLVSVLGHADRAGPLRDYCRGLLMAVDRKSVEPLAAVTAPQRTAAQHQSLLHFVGEGRWSDQAVLTKVGEMVLPTIQSHEPIEAWIIDDTWFLKKGKHSVGVRPAVLRPARQSGQLPGCRIVVGCKRLCESAGGVSPLSSGRIGVGSGTAQEDRCPRSDRV